MFEQKSTESIETVCTRTIQKGKFLFDFLLVEFIKDNRTIRIRFRVVQKRYAYGFRIMESGSKWTDSSQVRGNRIEIGTSISRQQLYKAVAKHLSLKQHVPRESMIFRWENNSLKMPESQEQRHREAIKKSRIHSKKDKVKQLIELDKRKS